MIKTLALDTPNIKITDNDTPIKLTPYDDGVKLEAGTWVPNVYIASNTSAFTKSIPAIWEGDKVVIQSSTLADLPVDKYDVEVWLNDGSEQLIYPDYGYVKLNINQTVAGINANLISSVTVAEFRDMFNSLATDINASIADLAVDANVVHKAGNETVTDTKTFSSPIVGSVTGNAGTSTKLTTARKLKVNLASTADQTFDGSADQVGIGVSGLLPTDKGGTGRADGLVNALATRTATFTDFATVANDMPTYAGIWKVGNSQLTNAPSGANSYYIVEVIPFMTSDAGIIRITVLSLGATYITTVNSRVLGSWYKVSKDTEVIHNAVGSVIMNSSSSASGESVGTWANIGSATIGTTTVYYWKRTA